MQADKCKKLTAVLIKNMMPPVPPAGRRPTLVVTATVELPHEGWNATLTPDGHEKCLPPKYQFKYEEQPPAPGQWPQQVVEKEITYREEGFVNGDDKVILYFNDNSRKEADIVVETPM